MVDGPPQGGLQGHRGRGKVGPDTSLKWKGIPGGTLV